MDGINPTLAFAALFLGLSGHPRDVAQIPVEPEHSVAWQFSGSSDQQVGYLIDCPAVTIAMDGQELPTATQVFGRFQDQRVALAGSILTIGPGIADAPSAPGWLSGEIFHDDDRCGELAPQP